jgi:isopentenyl-diphosphate delta-isomerase
LTDQVSFAEDRELGAYADSELLILVDETDRELGYLDRARCHAGRGLLHRAFSLLIFNAKGQLLLQQRAATKQLWPLVWSNSCCSHPRRNESIEVAARRRLHEELGLNCALHYLFKFQYQAQFNSAAAENELCSVYIGRATERVTINPAEINAWRWISPEALQAEMAGPDKANFTPWFRLEWERVWGEHRADVLALR